MSIPKVVFAGDRAVAVDVLRFLTEQDIEIAALLLPTANESSHDSELLSLCDHLEQDHILRGKQFHESEGIQLLEDINPDYILTVHFQYIVPQSVLDTPEHGVVNLHPAYLPYNRGWHTPSWAIWEQTIYGATLHLMTEKIDAGDIIARQRVQKQPDDTADSLYNRTLNAEVELFKSTWSELANFEYKMEPQPEEYATTHRKDDIEEIREIDLDEYMQVGTLLRKLRALTTNRIDEAAYFTINNTRYRVQLNIIPDNDDSK